MKLYLALLIGLLAALSPLEASHPHCKTVIVGAGPGGIYTAWRLWKSGEFPADRICIYERSPFFGGRLRFVDSSEVPELNQLVVNLGGVNFHTKEHVIAKALIEDIFELETECYSRNDDCVDHKPFKEMRGKVLTKEQLQDSSNWPYNFRPDSPLEFWNETHPRVTPFDFIPMNFGSVLGPYFPLLESPDENVRWQAAVDAMAAFANATYNGIPTHQLTIRSLVGSAFSNEYFAADRDYFGNIPVVDFIYGQNLYESLRLEIYNAALQSHLGVSKQMKGNVPYGKFVELMLNELQAAGANVFFNKKVVSVTRLGHSHNMRVKLEDGTHTNVKSVFLNMQLKHVNDLDSDCVIWQDADPDVLHAIRSLYSVTLSKVYLHYNHAWWRSNSNLRSGTVSTSNILGDVQYHNGALDCTDPERYNCSGLLLAGYVSGEIMRRHFQSYDLQRNPEDALVVLRRSNPLSSVLLDELHAYLMEMHSGLIDTSEIEPPTYGIYADWPEGASALRAPTPNNLPGGSLTAKLVQPVPNLDLFIVNNEFGQVPGWAESSFIMVEKALHRFGVAKPDYVSQPWYWANVEVDN